MSLGGEISGQLIVVASPKAANRIPEGYVFATSDNTSPNQELAFSGVTTGHWELPELSESEKQTLLARYNGVITNIGLENGSESWWWYTWSSCRDRYYSHISTDLEFLARLDKACEMGLPSRLVLLCSDPFLARALIQHVRNNGIIPKISMEDRLDWIRRRIRMKVAPLISGVKVCGAAIKKKQDARGITVSLEEAAQAPTRTLLITWIKGENLLESCLPQDTYFGPLPGYMAKANHSVVVFGDLSDQVPAKGQGRPASWVSPVVATTHFLGYWTIFRSYLRAVLSPLPNSGSLRPHDSELETLVRKDIHANRASAVYSLLFESALTGLLKKFRPTQIIHICENNPWERACYRAAKKLTPKPELTGFMHCAALLSHTKIVITDAEKTVRPRPKRLICTGPRARDVMVRYGGHSPDEVQAGSALRQTYLSQVQHRKRLNRPIKNILVVLDGLPTTFQFVMFIYRALEGNRNFQTTIRPHPAQTAEIILRETGLREPHLESIRFSRNKEITQDLEGADIVVYKGSTAAMEAGYMGIPLVHVESGNLLTDDPLFEIDSLKKVARTPEELVTAIKHFSDMSDGEFDCQLKSLRNYVEEYLSMPSEETISPFFPISTAVGAS